MSDRYEIVRELGRSPYALTSLANDKETSLQCVIKSLDAGEAADLKIIELFRREAKVLRTLDHDGIPNLVDYFEEKTESSLTLNLVQEYVPGRNLAEVVEAEGTLDEARVRNIARQLLEVLRYIHSFSPTVIHRDIKPGNVVLSKDDEVHLIDFSGVRDQMNQDREPGGGGFTIVGTYGYMPYEQYEGRALPASDIYSAGMTLLFLLSGAEPMDLERDGLQTIVPDNLEISGKLRGLIERMIEPDWKQRFETAEEALASLDRIEGRHHKPHSTRTLATVGASAILLVLSVIALRQEPEPPPAAPPAEAAKATRAPEELTQPVEYEPPPAEQGPQIPESASPDLVATLLWAGRPFNEVETTSPAFSICCTAEGKRSSDTSFRYKDGTVEVFELAEGESTLNAISNRPDSRYQGSVRFYFDPRVQAAFEINMRREFSITSPEIVRGPNRCIAALPGPVVVEWTSIGDGVHYDYEVRDIPCDGNTDTKVIQSGTTAETSISLELPPTSESRIYYMSIGARLRGVEAGRGSTAFRVGTESQ